jgi:hypothetical protein
VNRLGLTTRGRGLIGAAVSGVEPTPGDVDAEVTGVPGQAVVVALSDGAESRRPVSAVDLEDDDRGFHGRGGLECVLGGRAGCSGGDDEVVDVGERPQSTLTAVTIRWMSGWRLGAGVSRTGRVVSRAGWCLVRAIDLG